MGAIIKVHIETYVNVGNITLVSNCHLSGDQLHYFPQLKRTKAGFIPNIPFLPLPLKRRTNWFHGWADYSRNSPGRWDI